MPSLKQSLKLLLLKLVIVKYAMKNTPPLTSVWIAMRLCVLYLLKTEFRFGQFAIFGIADRIWYCL